MPRGILVSLTVLAGIVTCAVATGCGSQQGDVARTTAGIRVKAPSPPDETACAANVLRTSASPDDLVPRSGTYSYAVNGTKKVVGSSRPAEALPTRAEFIITPERTFGNVRCFNVQRRYTSALADTATFAVRGGDVYLTRLVAQNGGEFISIDPNPPVVSLNGSEQQWSGEFSGPTSARYRAEVIGVKRMKLGAAKVQAVGIKSEIKFNGELDGSENSERWISSSKNVVLMESVTQRRKFGLDELELAYKARLVSAPG